jgi:hypothetical protein
MEQRFETTGLRLDRATFLTLDDAPGAELTCLDGCLWITRDGSPADIQLPAGGRYVVADGTRVLVCAFVPSRVRLCRPRPAARRPSPLAGLISRARSAWRRCVAPPAVAAA